MAKKNEIFSVGMKLRKSDVIGTFDKDENGAYIIIVDGEKYLFEEHAEYFLGGTIEIHAVDMDGE